MKKGSMKGKPGNFARPAKPQRTHQSAPTAFSFGDPESVLASNITDYLGIFVDPHGDYYTPPISQPGLAKMLRANGHHGTIPYFKRNMLCRWLKDSPTVTRHDMGKAAFDLEVFGNAYFKVVLNRVNQAWWLEHLPAMNMRRMKERDRYCMLVPGKDPVPFAPGEVAHIKEYDPCQSIYGTPQYLGGMQSVLLNEDATLFRRKYYLNGAHMGYVFYTADADFDEAEETALKEAVKGSKGVGNFRSMFLNLPGGKPDSVKIIPIGDVATKDEFERIKNISRNDILAMWRINGALAGILPETNGGFGDLDKITRNNYENEVVPRQQDFLQLNQVLPAQRHIGFSVPDFKGAEG